WQTRSSPSQVNCWSRSAKWPDGQPFTVFDVFEQANTSANVELNKKRDAESIVTRNQWVVSTRQKLIACETGAAALFDEQRRDQPEKCASWSLASAPDNPDWRLGRTRVSLAQSVGLLIYLWRLPGGNLRCAQIKLHKEERTISGSKSFPEKSRVKMILRIVIGIGRAVACASPGLAQS